MSFRHDIQMLRGIAVLLVVGFHVFPDWVPSGFVGVDVFFVISGYLILGSIFRQRQEGDFDYVVFIAKRVKRLLPPLLAVICICSLVAPWVFIPSDLLNFSKSALSSIFYISNFYFEAQANYFDTQLSLAPLLHTWSLSVEEQFYLVAPALMLLVTGPTPSKARKQIAYLLVGLFLFAYLVSLKDPGFAYFASPTRFWQFLIGGLVAIAPASRTSTSLSNRWIRSTAIVTLVSISLIPTHHLGGQFAAICFATVVSTVLIHIGSHQPNQFNRGIGRLMGSVGSASYSIYLWHWPVLVFMPTLTSHALQTFDRALVLIISIALGFISMLLIEEPLKRLRITRPTKAVWQSAFIACAFVFAVAYTLPHWQLVSPAAANHKIAAYLDYDWKPHFAYGSCFITKDHAQASAFDWDRCVTHDTNKVRMLLLGDSHAAHWASAFRDRYARTHEISQITSAGCRPGLPLQGETWCEEILGKGLSHDFLRTLQPHITVLAGRWESDDIPRLVALVEDISQFSTVFVIGPVPEYTLPLPRLLLKEMYRHDVMKYSSIDRVASVDAELNKRLSPTSAIYLSVVEQICDDTRSVCEHATPWGEPVAFDYGHLTHQGARWILEDLFVNWDTDIRRSP